MIDLENEQKALKAEVARLSKLRNRMKDLYIEFMNKQCHPIYNNFTKQDEI